MSPSPEHEPHGLHDVTVLGAGPAGAAAAIEAATLGLRVAVIDEQPAAGGQVYRIAPGIAPTHPDPDRVEGDRLRSALSTANVDRCFDHRVWHVERVDEEWHVHSLGPEGPQTTRAKALIVATGAQERHVPFDGWDRTGVMGVAAATVLLKAQRVLPGRNVVVAGAGPLLLVVAKSIIEGGGRVAAIVDANPRGAWLAHAADLISRPDLIARGLGWVRRLKRAGVPTLHGHILRAVHGDSPSLRAVAVAVDGNGHARPGASTTELACDAVCCGFGLMPATDVTRLAGASHAFDPTRGGWHAIVDADQRSDVPRLYVAGDGAGIAGAAAAPLQGRIAAHTAARDLGRSGADKQAAEKAKRAQARATHFGRAMTQIANVGDGAIASIPADVIVCQCERLTRGTLDRAIADGCATINELKANTRCGMGPCGGRLCEETAARLIALQTRRTRADIGQATGRPPLRPVDIDALAGEFDYDALPMPAPSPL